MTLKKLLAIVISVIMLLSVCSVGVFAEENEEHTDEDVASIVMYGIIETSADLTGLKKGEIREVEYTVGDVQLNVTYTDGEAETLTYTPSLPENAEVTFYTSEYYTEKSAELYKQYLIDNEESSIEKFEAFTVNYGELKCDLITINDDGSFEAVNSGAGNLYYSVEYAEEDYQAIGEKYANAEITVDECPQTYLPVDVYKNVYRLYNPNSGEHFYTTSVTEQLFLTIEGWKYEGISWYAPNSGDQVYRLYNPNAGDHHYTTKVSEVNNLIKLGWRLEGAAFYSADESGNAIYRRYNPNAVAGAHFFTANSDEGNYLVTLGWHDEAVAFYGY